MAQLFANGARAELSAPITNSATSLTVTGGGNGFPDTTGGHFFYAVLQDDAGYEIIRVSSHLNGTSPNSMSSILRGQFGTSARAFAAGAIIGQRVVAADMDAAVNGRVPSNILGITTGTMANGNEVVPIEQSGGGLRKLTLSAVWTWFRAQAMAWTGRQVFKSTGYDAEYNAGTVTTSVTINFADGQNQRVVLGAAAPTIYFSFPGVGHYQLIVQENGTGGYTPTVGTAYRVVGGTSLEWNTAADAETIVSVHYNGSVVYAGTTKVGA